MRISIASDHGGFELKNELVKYLQEKNIEVIDHGCPSIERVDYPDYAKFVCEDIQNGVSDYGVLVCYTGIGMSIYANKFKNIRAALVCNLDSAKLTKQHNNSNIICLSGKFTKVSDAKMYVDAFLREEFEGGRHINRVNKIIEKDNQR